MTSASAASERRQLTVMFTDLVGSTELASALDPEDWHDVLNAYQHVVAAIVTANGGIVAQFQGDGAVAYFGYPEASESASRDALSAGIALLKEMEELGASLPPELGVGDLQARAGVHTGEVVVAAITAGGQERLPDVWGQVPNLAARLQAAAEPGQIVISNDSAQLVAGYFELESLGELALKGISRPVAVFRVLKRSGARHRLEARPLTSFIPRPVAMSWLEEQWAAVRQGPGWLVLVTGEPGIGKSRLLFEFSSVVGRGGHFACTVLCSRRGSLSPLQPFAELLGEVPATPQEVVAWVEARARAGPMLLVVEDAHWADPSTLEAIHLISRGTSPVLVVVSARPEMVDNSQFQPQAFFSLDRLTGDEARELVELLPESAEIDPTRFGALVERADGVPLFLEELARALTEGADLPGEALPTTLAEVITTRLDRVGEARRVAQAAAVIGRSFDRPVLIAATGIDATTLDDYLRRLQEHAIIEPTARPSEFQFRHALFHEASYRSLVRADRMHVHGAVGEFLVHSGRADARPEVAAFHLGAAGRAKQAVPLWKRAAHTARQNARFQEAAGHERELLRLIASLPGDEQDVTELKSRSRLVMCLTAVDQSAPEALEESRRVEELARRLGDHEILLRNYMILVPWWQASAEYETVNAVLDKARKEAEGLGDDWTLQLISMYEAATRIWQGKLRQGVEQITAAYEAIGFPLDETFRELPAMRSVELIAFAAPRIATALACWLCGRTGQAWQIANDVLLGTTERRVPQAQAVAAVTAAIIAQLDGERETVIKLASEALHVADEVSTRQWRQWAESLQWWAGEGIEVPDVPGPLLGPYFQMLLADDVHVADDRAIGLLGDALETCRVTGERFCEAEILRVRAGRLLRSGAEDSAARDFGAAVAIAREQGAALLELKALTDWARTPGAPEGVHTELEACIAEVSAGGACGSLDRARRTQAGE